jgi:hypothetical protein
MSYMHVEWVAQSKLESDRILMVRVRKFLNSPLAATDPAEAIDQSFLEVERVVAREEHQGEVKYLIKWNNLPYADCTRTRNLCTNRMVKLMRVMAMFVQPRGRRRRKFATTARLRSSSAIRTTKPRSKSAPLSVFRSIDSHFRLKALTRSLSISTDRFRRFILLVVRMNCRHKAAPQHRPVPSQWIKFDKSPEYKNGNTLRPYQLEGLNWLSFCWHHRQNSILADEMGLGTVALHLGFVSVRLFLIEIVSLVVRAGKTVQTVSVLHVRRLLSD